ncbi:MAG: hypothetical protein ACKOE2_15830, partial [Actinomycetales bacterium]
PEGDGASDYPDLDSWVERLASVPSVRGPMEPSEIATYAHRRMAGPRMPHLSETHRAELGSVVTATLTHGRLVMSPVLEALGWHTGQSLVARPVQIGSVGERPAARLEASGPARPPAVPTKVGDRGRVLVPASVRAWMNVIEGAEVTVVALPKQQHAALLPWATLAAMLGEPLGEHLEPLW